MEAWRREAINARNAAALKIDCPDPNCGAKAGEQCWGKRGGRSKYPHFRRQDASPMTETVSDIIARHVAAGTMEY